MLYQGFQLLDRFAQEGRIRIARPRRNQQIKFSQAIGSNNDFIAMWMHRAAGRNRLSAGVENHIQSLSGRMDGLLALDPQLVCYSWMTGIAEVAEIAFVRKRLVEVQYLRTTITRGSAPGVRFPSSRHDWAD